jgi:hypothetical protein
MSHFAKVENGIVTQIIVAEQDVIDSGLFGQGWIQTSYNTRGGVHYGQDGNPDGGIALRGNYAFIGGTYDAAHDVFYAEQPSPSWVLNQSTWEWEPPIPYPTDNYRYTWNESTVSWIVDDSYPQLTDDQQTVRDILNG